MKKTTYELNVHFKQGADFSLHLKEQKKNIPNALDAWAKDLQKKSALLKKIAQDLRTNTSRSTCSSDTNFISITTSTDLSKYPIVSDESER